MSYWIDQVRNHPIHDSLGRILVAADALLAAAEGYEAISVEQLERIKQVTSAIIGRIQSVDPLLLSSQVLNNLNNPLSRAAVELASFQSSKNRNQLANVITHIDNALVHFAAIPAPTGLDDIGALKDAMTSFRKSSKQYLHGIDDQSKKVQASLNEINARVASIGQTAQQRGDQIERLITELQEKFRVTEDQRQLEFRRMQDERSRESKDAIQEMLVSIKAQAENRMTALTEIERDGRLHNEQIAIDLKSQSDDLIGQIEMLRTKGEQLVGIISNAGMIGGYQKEANQAKKGSRSWKVLATLSFAGLVAFAVYIFFRTLNVYTTMSWSLFGMRAFAALAFGILGAYAALQAEKLDKAERRYRRMELELASISPFLHDLPETDQQKMKIDLAQKLFGQQEAERVEPDNKTTGSALDLVRLALESVESMVQNLAKK